VLPEAAEKGDAAGAEAFIAYWFAVANYAQQTGDTEQLRALSGSECVVCDDLIEGIDELYGSGGRIEGRLWALDSAVSPPPDPDGVVLATARFTQASGTLIDSAGTRTAALAKPAENAGFVLSFEGAWSVFGIGEL